MKFANLFAKAFRYLLPSPFAIALLLTLLTFVLALVFTTPVETGLGTYAWQLTRDWSSELWNASLMTFAMQMMLMLVLGHVLALSPIVARGIDAVVNRFCKTQAQAALSVTLLTLVVALFNWGLGLVFGAIFARKVGEYYQRNQRPLNYALIGAAGYSGLMVWHGGISGSSLVKVAEEGHLRSMMQALYSPEQIAALPAQITFDSTVFSGMNIFASVVLLVALPALMWLVGKKASPHSFSLQQGESEAVDNEKAAGAERIDQSRVWGSVMGVLLVILTIALAWQHPNKLSFGFINPNWINLLLLGMALALHQRFSQFLKAVNEAIGGGAGILIQFPLYFGIMGLMKSSGLVSDMAEWFAEHATQQSYPIFTFISAAVVNVFVPSGGGQWAVQGPIIVQSAQALEVSLSKSIMAMAYGDQLTNMLQPFWALPLLGITQLHAKQILPYTLLLMLAGAVLFISVLLLF